MATLGLILAACATGGTRGRDAGASSPDAGPAGLDGGARPDAGPAGTDAGPTGFDAGSMGLDAGPTPRDAGSDAGRDAGPGPSDAGALSPELGLPDPSGAPCSSPGSLGECPGIEVCRFFTPAEGRCESCAPCGNLGDSCATSAECDILFMCFRGRCTNFCTLGTFECGPIEDCLDVGHSTRGVCRP